MPTVEELDYIIVQQQHEIDRLRGVIQAFYTGDVPENASIDHLILAKYGRIRLAEKAKTPALLAK
jgi:hypothetical protein